MRGRADHVVHLELRTTNLPRACSFYTQLFGWRAERIEACGASYLSLNLGPGIDGGIVEQNEGHAVWLPYVEVANLAEATAHALVLGGSVVLDPREGPVGWRSVVATPAGGEIALWQPKQ
jgi:hypothetical protein